MTAKTRAKIENGIRCYKYERTVLLRLLRRYGGLKDDVFDRLFSDYKEVMGKDNVKRLIPREEKLRFWCLEGDSFILGTLSQDGWSSWLNLLQFMCLLGEVRWERKGGHTYYYLSVTE